MARGRISSAILDQGTKKPKPVWPEYWKQDELEKVTSNTARC